jgi:hypothetical protein
MRRGVILYRQPAKIRPSQVTHGRHWGREVTVPKAAAFDKHQLVTLLYDARQFVLVVKQGTHVDEAALEKAVGGRVIIEQGVRNDRKGISGPDNTGLWSEY